jgi:hypothetical protein
VINGEAGACDNPEQPAFEVIEQGPQVKSLACKKIVVSRWPSIVRNFIQGLCCNVSFGQAVCPTTNDERPTTIFPPVDFFRK